MGTSQYYDLNPIRSKLDINGKQARMFIITGNRSAGKTHAMCEHVLSFLRKGRYRQIALLCRNKYELDDICESFFSVSNWMHPSDYYTGKVSKMGYAPLYYNGKMIGYGLSLRASDNLKRCSGLFQFVDCMVWDEFQREDNQYIKNEARALKSIISTVSRGGGEQGRKVPCYLLSNTISVLSPILADLEIASRIHKNTRFVRGDGFIFEQSINQSALEAQKDNTLSIGRENYLGGTSVVYMNDNLSGVEKISGNLRYMETFIVDGERYAIKYSKDLEVFYCCKLIDKYCKRVYTRNKQEINDKITVPFGIPFYRKHFDKGMFRFENIECKSAIIKYLSY